MTPNFSPLAPSDSPLSPNETPQDINLRSLNVKVTHKVFQYASTMGARALIYTVNGVLIQLRDASSLTNALPLR